jgi:hypothetical protein
MQRPSAVSRPAWINAISGSGANRKSPVEILATAASVVTRSPYAEVSGLRAGKFGRWTDGVTAMRGDCVAFAAYWRAHNERVLRDLARETEPGPLWVALGDSTAQGLGAPARTAATSGRRCSSYGAAPASTGGSSTCPSPAR